MEIIVVLVFRYNIGIGSYTYEILTPMRHLEQCLTCTKNTIKNRYSNVNIDIDWVRILYEERSPQCMNVGTLNTVEKSLGGSPGN